MDFCETRKEDNLGKCLGENYSLIIVVTFKCSTILNLRLLRSTKLPNFMDGQVTAVTFSQNLQQFVLSH